MLLVPGIHMFTKERGAAALRQPLHVRQLTPGHRRWGYRLEGAVAVFYGPFPGKRYVPRNLQERTVRNAGGYS